ncbi:MAG: phytoene/squalene synthase family protein [Chloroflexi bacterium]|nr:phytoene/squalene synthase family protein [Chloroflexota bacterium]
MAIDAPSRTLAYAECRAFTKRRATNFYYAFSSLPRGKRNAIYAAYAFAGTVDDAVDEAGSREQRLQRLAEARGILARAYGDAGAAPAEAGEDWLAVALGDAAARFDIPREYFDDLIAGMEQDLDQRRYETYAELLDYCYKAASVIGLICVEIFGYDRSRAGLAREAAIDMGRALQLTNILRDVREDAARDRIYLAQEDLRRHGYGDADVLANRYNDEFRALMADYAGRARALYDSGLRLIPLLDGPRSRMCCNGLQGVYRSILAEIVKRDYDVYSARVSPSKVGRVLLLFRLWIGGATPRRRPR